VRDGAHLVSGWDLTLSAPKSVSVLWAEAALRAELTARLGDEWTVVDRHGQAEPVGVPVGLRRLWSERHHAMEACAADRIAEAEASLGRSLTAMERHRAFEVALLETRAAKVQAPRPISGCTTAGTPKPRRPAWHPCPGSATR
jgi:hypothetical protein